MTLFFIAFAALLAPAFASWSNTETESITACTTQYGPASNTTQDWGFWVTTDTYTTSAWVNLYKTEVLTPKPSTTTVSATSTSTYYYYPGDNMTTTVYTWTYSDTATVTQTETVASTTTVTVSSVETFTVPTLTGFVPVASASPLAAQKTNTWDDAGDWDVEDVYWTTETSPYIGYPIYATPLVADLANGPLPIDVLGGPPPPLPTDVLRAPVPEATGLLWRRQDAQSSQPLKVDCTLTIKSNAFVYGTSSIRQPGPRATYTRTSIVAFTTVTSTVRTKQTAPLPTEVFTISDTFYSYDTSSTTVTTTSVETVSRGLVDLERVTEHPKRPQRQSTPLLHPSWLPALLTTSSTPTMASGCASPTRGSPTPTTPSSSTTRTIPMPSTPAKSAARALSWIRRLSSGAGAAGALAVRSGRAMRRVVLLRVASMARGERRWVLMFTTSRFRTRGIGAASIWVMALVVVLGSCLCGSDDSDSSEDSRQNNSLRA